MNKLAVAVIVVMGFVILFQHVALESHKSELKHANAFIMKHEATIENLKKDSHK